MNKSINFLIDAGQVTFEEMIEYFIPNTFSKESWISLRQLLPSFYQEEIRRSLKETHFPSSMKHFRWPIKEIEKKIQDKIGERAANATVEKQDAFKIFDCPSKGITKPLFKSKMEKLGLFLSNREITELYKRYDPDGDGTITFQEFMSAVMPQDYSKQSNSTISNTTNNNNTTLRPLTASSSTNVAASYGQVAQAVLNMTEPHALKYLGRKRWSIEFMQELLREKIRSRTSNSNVEIQDAYKLFGRPQKGITLEIFREKLWEFGMEITSEEAKELFDHYDLNGSRTITFGELIEGVIPRDYSRKTWNVARTEEIIQQQQEKLRQMREGESRRHGRRQRNKHQHKKKNFDDNNNNNNQLGAFQNLNFHFENANENDTTTGGTMSLQGLQIEGKKANSPFLNQMCPPKSPRAFLTPINSKT
jgi:Ca2+-binding EF-hand superfamily protein